MSEVKSYIAGLTEINGEYEYAYQFVVISDDPSRAEQVARQTTLEWRGGAEWVDDSDFAWNSDGCTAVQFDYINEIPMEKAEVLSEYLFTVNDVSGIVT